MGISPLRGSLRAAPNEETEVSLYPTFPSWQSTAPHGCLVSLLIAHSGWRSWRQKTSCFEKSGKIRSTELFSFQGASEVGFIAPFTLQRTSERKKLSVCEKIFFCFFTNALASIKHSCRGYTLAVRVCFLAHSFDHAVDINI